MLLTPQWETLLEFADQGAEEFGCAGGLLEVLGIEGLQRLSQEFHAALSAFLQDFGALGGGFEAEAAFVVGRGAADQAGADEAGDDAAHGGRANLLGFGEFAERTRPSKNQDGKRGELCWADPADRVAGSDAAEQVDGGGMEQVGDLDGIGEGEYFLVAFGHRI